MEDNKQECLDWTRSYPSNSTVTSIDIHGQFCIVTLEGVMICSVGDWIIRGVKGEFYPCKADIFEATYERCVSVNISCGSDGDRATPSQDPDGFTRG